MSEITGENLERLRNYILRPELSLHNPLPDVLPRQFDPMRLLHVPRCPGSTKLAPRRDQSGQILEFVEVDRVNTTLDTHHLLCRSLPLSLRPA